MEHAQEMSTYEQERLKSIAENERVLASLGLLSRPAPTKRAPPRRRAPKAAGPARKKRTLPMRSTRARPVAYTHETSGSSSGESDGEADAPRAARPHRAAAARAMQLPGISEPQRRACEAAFGAAWRTEMARALEAPAADAQPAQDVTGPPPQASMGAFLSDAALQLEFCPRSRGACSAANKRQTLTQLALLASGEGIPHRGAPGAIFMPGEPLTLAHDAAELAAAAEDWLRSTAEDSGRGWLVGHPLGKFAGFQRYAFSLLESTAD